MPKYRNIKTVVDNIAFASKAEASRYSELRLLERSGAITDLKLQPKFLLTPTRYKEDGTVERASHYVADFQYSDLVNFKKVVEDVKGMKTKDYILKRKFMLHIYGITVQEVHR